MFYFYMYMPISGSTNHMLVKIQKRQKRNSLKHYIKKPKLFYFVQYINSTVFSSQYYFYTKRHIVINRLHQNDKFFTVY